MEKNEVKAGPVVSHFIQKHSVQIRIWHWLFFFLLTASMITILLVSTFLKPQQTSAVPQVAPSANSVVVTTVQPNAVSPESQSNSVPPQSQTPRPANPANQIARQYEERMLTIHKLIGFGLAFLLFSRILIELTHQTEEKISTRIKNAVGLYKKNDENKADYKHYISVKLGYTVFYVLITIMAITGIGLAFGRQVPFLRQMHRGLITVHAFIQYFIYAFVFIHLCGLVISDNRNAKGIVSGMINGNK